MCMTISLSNLVDMASILTYSNLLTAIPLMADMHVPLGELYCTVRISVPFKSCNIALDGILI